MMPQCGAIAGMSDSDKLPSIPWTDEQYLLLCLHQGYSSEQILFSFPKVCTVWPYVNIFQ